MRDKFSTALVVFAVCAAGAPAAPSPGLPPLPARWPATLQLGFTPADFHRHLLYGQTFVQHTRLRMVARQIPLGNTVMRADNNKWDHFQDNRVQWLLDSRAHLRAYVVAGYVGFLFGRGADGATCACDAARDGITNPPPIDGNTRNSISADDDGGYFKAQAAAYYRAGPLPL